MITLVCAHDLIVPPPRTDQDSGLNIENQSMMQRWVALEDKQTKTTPRVEESRDELNQSGPAS